MHSETTWLTNWNRLLVPHALRNFKLDEQVQPTPGMIIDKSVENSSDDAQRLRNVVTTCMTFLLTLSFDLDRIKENVSGQSKIQ
jgi:hypothetical protein